MTLLALILSVATIFIGGSAGSLIWVIGTVVLCCLPNAEPMVFQNPQGHSMLPIFILGVVIQLTSIHIAKWKGLLFHIVASILLVGALIIGLV